MKNKGKNPININEHVKIYKQPQWLTLKVCYKSNLSLERFAQSLYVFCYWCFSISIHTGEKEAEAQGTKGRSPPSSCTATHQTPFPFGSAGRGFPEEQFCTRGLQAEVYLQEGACFYPKENLIPLNRAHPSSHCMCAVRCVVCCAVCCAVWCVVWCSGWCAVCCAMLCCVVWCSVWCAVCCAVCCVAAPHLLLLPG